MMNLDEQIQTLMDNAPQDGATPAAVTAIAPVLKLVAAQLKHTTYYVLQNLQDQWVMVTISNRSESTVEKNVIYAFSALQDVASGPYAVNDPQMLAIPIPVIHILFQLVAMKTVDSAIFFDIPGNTKAGTEIRRADLQNLIQAFLQKAKDDNTVPPNIA